MTATRLTLAIETSNPSTDPASPGSVCIGEAPLGGAVRPLRSEALTPTGRHDDALAPAIQRLLDGAGVRPSGLQRVAVSVGPGGFTALRIAVTTTKLLCEATGAACVAVPTALVGARGCDATGRFCVVLASKGESAWAQAFERVAPGEPPRAMGDGALLDTAGVGRLHAVSPLRALVADRFLPETIRAWAEGVGVGLLPLRLGAEDCLRVSAGLPDADRLSLAPLYPREPEAVSKWRELHG